MTESFDTINAQNQALQTLQKNVDKIVQGIVAKKAENDEELEF